MGEKGRQPLFDVAKGFTIILVVAAHMEAVVTDYEWLYKIIFSFHMPMFFLISGYFMKDNIPGRIYIEKRARALFVPYAVTSFVLMAWSVAENAVCREKEFIIPELKAWCYAAFYGSGWDYTEPFEIKSIGAIWFLPALFWALCITRFAVTKKWGSAFVLSVVFAGIVSAQYIWLPFSIQAGMGASAFVYIGYLAKKKNWLQKRMSPVIVMLFLLVWCMDIFYGRGINMVRNEYGIWPLNVVGAVCGCRLILGVCQKVCGVLPTGILEYYGRNTLVFLCAHLVELNMVSWDFLQTPLKSRGIPKILGTGINLLYKVLWCSVWVVIVSFIKQKYAVYKKNGIFTCKSGN